MNRLIVLAIACLAISSGFAADGVHDAFVAGNQYRDLGEVLQKGYVIGVIDGFLMGELLGAPEKQIKEIANCISGRPTEQVHAIVNKYMDEHPEWWHQTMPSNVFRALAEICPKMWD